MPSPVVLRRIVVYPVKSLPGVSVSSAKVLPCGALENDRRYALTDSDGRYLNGKRTPKIHELRAEFNLAAGYVKLWTDALPKIESFDLARGRVPLLDYLSEHFGQRVRLQENRSAGFPDDEESPGPTVIGEASFLEVAKWFPGLTLEETRARFRANLELDVPAPFWEDGLLGPAGTAPEFRVGAVRYLAVNPCQRCVVPSRDSRTGEVTPLFAKRFSDRRAETLPSSVPLERFNHFYRLSLNTRLAESNEGDVVRVGDHVVPLRG